MRNSFASLLFGAALTLSVLPVVAQQEISNNQPVTRVSSAEETRIQGKMNLDFKKGLIDSTQLSAMQRDFDAILVHEDDFKARGLTSSGAKTISSQLAAFELRLDKAAGVSNTAAAERLSGPRVNKNNEGLSSVAPTR
jgi:hypothetical protein